MEVERFVHKIHDVQEDKPGVLERLAGPSVSVASSPVRTSIDIDIGRGTEAADVYLQRLSWFSTYDCDAHAGTQH